MAKIYMVEAIVEEALINNKSTRGDNFILYVEVLKHFIDTKMSLEEVFFKHKLLGIPSLESITRCRRRLQEKNPELRDEEATEIRAVEEEEFIKYSRGE